MTSMLMRSADTSNDIDRLITSDTINIVSTSSFDLFLDMVTSETKIESF